MFRADLGLKTACRCEAGIRRGGVVAGSRRQPGNCPHPGRRETEHLGWLYSLAQRTRAIDPGLDSPGLFPRLRPSDCPGSQNGSSITPLIKFKLTPIVLHTSTYSRTCRARPDPSCSQPQPERSHSGRTAGRPIACEGPLRPRRPAARPGSLRIKAYQWTGPIPPKPGQQHPGKQACYRGLLYPHYARRLRLASLGTVSG